ncbi:YadA C-terminal domain-containing protein [Yersinia enterocolitica]|uniref:YadA C-terminal domain-containing protein n=1 Tax=Yersinia enterocolitica TaxID=630 RepID=UPI0021E80380|nr:YadA C-terminal domain-containing protein [Yersinia enterocolitica]EKN3955243.1 YadA C-terminal domain-containing protein [Yersinia enterocolitica]EKN3996638.1 YadA C-terminal domain-containing protein [Yersinia enterocolitica]EKN4021852.1 YadA C-terminal domain-containing protein [Yersinia enterocolitica]EKN4085397.1 YadA C-terminal domain-containing protein [Yersinia enterocolitica]EKN4147813.1 YadA C-terminal domain-containing protein [Yersinia enterocolitica]
MKCHKLAFVMILTAISTPSSYAATYEHSADQISITSVNGGDGDLQTAFDQINGAIGGLSNDDFTTQGRLNALEQAPKAKDGINGTDGHDGTDDHHNDAAVQQNAKALSNDEARIGSMETQSNQNFANLKTEVDDNRDRADAGIAGVAAMANIPQVQESQQFALGAGIGGYGSEQALAVGASFHATQSTIVKLTVSNDTQHNFGWGAGTSYGW